MEYTKTGNDIILRLDKGEEVMTCIYNLAEKLDIKAASLTGLGATDDFSLGVYDGVSKTYKEKSYKTQHEISSLVGNITTKDNKPYLHVHATMASLDKVVGGHLTKAVISVTAEIFLHLVEAKVDRKLDEKININLLNFNCGK